MPKNTTHCTGQGSHPDRPIRSPAQEPLGHRAPPRTEVLIKKKCTVVGTFLKLFFLFSLPMRCLSHRRVFLLSGIWGTTQSDRLDFQPFREPVFLAPHHVRWEEDDTPDSQNGWKSSLLSRTAKGNYGVQKFRRNG